MHEMSIAQNLLALIKEEMEKNQVTRLYRVKIKAGEFNSIVHESLIFSFKALTEKTPFQGAELVIETIPAKLRCCHCQTEFVPELKETVFCLAPCPECGQDIGHQLIQGDELFIDYIEADS